jgi:peptide/nickel transport system substrate-binding protein
MVTFAAHPGSWNSIARWGMTTVDMIACKVERGRFISDIDGCCAERELRLHDWSSEHLRRMNRSGWGETEMRMTRRAVVGTALGASGALILPRIAHAATELKYVPVADLSSVDPVWTTLTSTRDHGYMVFDTLFAMDASLRVQPQMAQGIDTSADGLVATIRLRPGLRFHDNTPVLARDCVASIKRWAPRDAFGRRLLAVTDALTAPDDATIRFDLKSPFPNVDYALGKPSTPVPFMMPAHIVEAATKGPIKDVVGSGPFRFIASEWMQGSRAAYERFDGYVPREEAPSGTAGGKRVFLDRVVWTVIPDPTTAAAALQTGEVDWYGWPTIDMVPLLERDKNIRIVQFDPLGFVPIGRMNQLQPPFNNPKVRQAFATAVNQQDFMAAAIGDSRFYRSCTAFLPCGGPWSVQTPTPISGDLEKGRKLLAESGYDGTKAVILSASDSTVLSACCAVANDVLQKIGMKTDLVAVDVGNLMRRRLSQAPVDAGGWSLFVTTGGAIGNSNPADFSWVQADGLASPAGWPQDARLHAAIAAFANATTDEVRKRYAAEIQADAASVLPFIPLGQYQQPTAYRTSLSGILPAGVPLFWNVKKA